MCVCVCVCVRVHEGGRERERERVRARETERSLGSIEHISEGLQKTDSSATHGKEGAQIHNRLRALILGAVGQALLLTLGQLLVGFYRLIFIF